MCFISKIYIQEQKSPINEYYNPKFIKMKLIIIRTKHLKQAIKDAEDQKNYHLHGENHT